MKGKPVTSALDAGQWQPKTLHPSKRQNEDQGIMAFDLHIPENSRRGQVIQMIVDQLQSTPEQVLDQIVGMV